MHVGLISIGSSEYVCHTGVSNCGSVASLSVGLVTFCIPGVSGLGFSALVCDGLGNRQHGAVLLQFTLISPASRVWNYTLGGLPRSHFTRLQVISQTRPAYTSPVPQFSQPRIWTFILLRPLFFHLSTLLIYVRLSLRVHGRGVTTAWCEIGFDLSEKSGRDRAPLSVRPSSAPHTFHMHFHSDLSQNKGKWFLPCPFVLERGDKLQMCSRAFVLEMAFSCAERKLMKSVEHIKVVWRRGRLKGFESLPYRRSPHSLSSPILVTGSFELSSPVN